MSEDIGMPNHAERLRRMSPRLDILDCEHALQAADHIEALEAALRRIGQPGREIVYCRDGHEEAVLIARAALRPDREGE